MPTRTNITTAKQITRASLAIHGSLDSPEILDAVAPLGYTAAVFADGQARYDRVQALLQATTTRRGTKARVTRSVSDAERAARTAATRLGTIVRAVFLSDPAARATLGVTGRLPDSRDAFLAYAETLFASALAAPTELAARLASLGYTTAKLTSEQAKIAALRAEQTAQAAAKGDSEQETVRLTEALAHLNEWVMQYRKLARLALADRPQLLEKLGIAAHSK